MSYDRRDVGNGQFKAHTLSTSERCEAARTETQTRKGEFTHSRDPRRMDVKVDQFDAQRFKNGRVNRDAYHPKVL